VDHGRQRIFAGRVLASRRALTASFRRVFEELRDEGFDEQQAFSITKRVKRGLGDTSGPGGYIKDHIYLEGDLLVEQFVAQGGDVRRLYVGKIGLQQLDLLEPDWLTEPRFIPR